MAQSRESPSGFHYINLYQCCPRRWFLLYLKGYRPKYTARPLIQGAAFHLGKALWYQGKAEKTCIKKALEYVESAKNELENQEECEEILYRVRNLLHYWIERCGKLDREEFKVINVENELIVPISDTEYRMTIRPDAVLMHKGTGLYYILETKTSSFSKKLTEEGVLYGDQATAYTWGVEKMLNIKIDGVIPDIAYWNKSTRNISNIEMIRGEIVQRSQYEIEAFERGMAQLFSEVTQKTLAWKKGTHSSVLFPRNTYYCMSYFSLCPYAQVCKQDIDTSKKIPQGFRKESANRKLGGICWDDLGV